MAEESNTQSAFGFLQNNVSTLENDSSTSFSFMQGAQQTIAPDNVVTSLDLQEKRSSFSFLGQGDVNSSTNSNDDNQSFHKISGANGSNIDILSAASISAEDGVIKLGKTSATKAVSESFLNFSNNKVIFELIQG